MQGMSDSNAAQTPRRTGWLIHALLLALYPVTIGLLGLRSGADLSGPALPASVLPLLLALSVEMLLFLAVFGLACLASRPDARQLLLRWEGGSRPLWLGLGYSLALRLALALLIMLLAVIAQLPGGFGTDALSELQPDISQLVDTAALADNPAYLLLNLTLVSFVVAGLREELWRAGMLAALFVLFPRLGRSLSGQAVAVGGVAVLFGFGHLMQGPGGVVMTTLLGCGLGAIMLWHRSIWPAVLAHGCFNATSFLMLFAVARGGL